MAETILSQEVTRGSDHAFQITWQDAAGDPLDFTGYTLSFFDEAPSLVGRISGTISNAAAGQLTIAIEGAPPLSLGLHSFRVMLTLGTQTLATKRLYLKVV